MSEPFRVLVLCTGNIGRSPLAAKLLERALANSLRQTDAASIETGVVVSSAGVDAPVGHPASKRGIIYAAEREIDLTDHEATQLTRELLAKSDVIYGMDSSHFSGVAALDPEALARMVLWEGEGREIPDPHHHNDDVFRKVAARIEAALPDRVDEIMAMLTARFSG